MIALLTCLELLKCLNYYCVFDHKGCKSSVLKRRYSELQISKKEYYPFVRVGQYMYHRTMQEQLPDMYHSTKKLLPHACGVRRDKSHYTLYRAQNAHDQQCLTLMRDGDGGASEYVAQGVGSEYLYSS